MIFMQKCEKCGKIYLNRDSPSKKDEDELNFCDCGGKLVYIQDFMGHVLDEIDPYNEMVFSSEFTLIDTEEEPLSGKSKSPQNEATISPKKKKKTLKK